MLGRGLLTPPQTPVSRSRADSNQTHTLTRLTTSPYFRRAASPQNDHERPGNGHNSPSQQSRTPPHCPRSSRNCKSKPLDDRSLVKLRDEMEDIDKSWWQEEQIRLNDPLYCFFLRKFTTLYEALLRVKPVLIQECVAHDPWKLLIATMLLNKTTGKVAIPAFWEILERWPTPNALSKADHDELKCLIQPLGIHDRRATRLIALSCAYIVDPPDPSICRPTKAYVVPLRDDLTGEAVSHIKQQYPPTPVSHLPGAGPYAMDSYIIFCGKKDEWKSVMPADKELIRYLKWKWAFYERTRWDPIRGVIGSFAYVEEERVRVTKRPARVGQEPPPGVHAHRDQ